MKRLKLFQAIAVVMVGALLFAPLAEYAYAALAPKQTKQVQLKQPPKRSVALQQLKSQTKLKLQPQSKPTPLPQQVGKQRQQAQQQPGPQVQSNKPVVIMGKINELLKKWGEVYTSANNNEGGREYLAFLGGPEPLKYNDEIIAEDAYNAFVNECNAAINDCNAAVNGVVNMATGDFPTPDDTGWFEVFRYEKMAASPYPLVFYGDKNQYYGRDPAGQQAALTIANAMKTQNKRICDAAASYIAAIGPVLAAYLTPGGEEDDLKQKITVGWRINAEIARRLFGHSNEGSIIIGVERANKRYERDNRIYDAYAGYSDACFKAYHHLNTYTWLIPDREGSFKYTLYKKVNIYLTTWYQVAYEGADATYFFFDCDGDSISQGSERGQLDPKGGSVTESWFFNTAAMRGAIRKDVVSFVEQHCGRANGALVRDILDTYEDPYVRLNRQFNQHRKAMKDLVDKLNKIIKDYRAYFPYHQGYQLSPLQDWPVTKAFGKATFRHFPVEPVYGSEPTNICTGGAIVVGSGSPVPVSMSANITANGALGLAVWQLYGMDYDVDYYDPARFSFEVLGFGPSATTVQTSFKKPEGSIESGKEVWFRVFKKEEGVELCTGTFFVKRLGTYKLEPEQIVIVDSPGSPAPTDTENRMPTS